MISATPWQLSSQSCSAVGASRVGSDADLPLGVGARRCGRRNLAGVLVEQDDCRHGGMSIDSGQAEHDAQLCDDLVDGLANGDEFSGSKKRREVVVHAEWIGAVARWLDRGA